MNDPKNDPKRSSGQFSLQGEIKKRKTQEIQKQIEDKKIASARGNTPSIPDPCRTTTSASVIPPAPVQGGNSRRTSQTMAAANTPAAKASARQSQTTAAVGAPSSGTPATSTARTTLTAPVVKSPAIKSRVSRRLRLIAVGASTALVLIVVMFALFAVTSQASVPPLTATLIPLPVVSASNVVGKLKQAGLLIANIHPIAAPNENWSASEEIQFDLQQGKDKGIFIVLSYPDASHKVSDFLRATRNAKFKTWHHLTQSNIIIFASPETSSDMVTQVGTQVLQYLVMPYRPLLQSPPPPPAS